MKKILLSAAVAGLGVCLVADSCAMTITMQKEKGNRFGKYMVTQEVPEEQVAAMRAKGWTEVVKSYPSGPVKPIGNSGAMPGSDEASPYRDLATYLSGASVETHADGTKRDSLMRNPLVRTESAGHLGIKAGYVPTKTLGDALKAKREELSASSVPSMSASTDPSSKLSVEFGDAETAAKFAEIARGLNKDKADIVVSFLNESDLFVKFGDAETAAKFAEIADSLGKDKADIVVSFLNESDLFVKFDNKDVAGEVESLIPGNADVDVVRAFVTHKETVKALLIEIIGKDAAEVNASTNAVLKGNVKSLDELNEIMMAYGFSFVEDGTTHKFSVAPGLAAVAAFCML